MFNVDVAFTCICSSVHWPQYCCSRLYVEGS